MPPTDNLLFWYYLYASHSGLPFMGTSADMVSVPGPSCVVNFRDAVLAKNAKILSEFVPSQLVVYANKDSFDNRYTESNRGKPLDEDFLFGPEVGATKREALIVVVPCSTSSSRSNSESSLTVNDRNPNRKRRWVQINEVADKIAKAAKSLDSTGYSNFQWNDVEHIFRPQNYVQELLKVDDEHLDFLAKYLSFATTCFGKISTGKEAKRIHFIAPVLLCVCVLFNGDVQIVAEEDLPGNFIRAHGRFEFMLKRGNRVICIVEAKRDDIQQGMAQGLVGCEVASELGGLDVVYGIVTSYVQWNFYRCSDNKIEEEECSFRLTPKGPETESLIEITSKIYSILSHNPDLQVSSSKI